MNTENPEENKTSTNENFIVTSIFICRHIHCIDGCFYIMGLYKRLFGENES
jgi:hypothetical protein